jgi:hypothetical protein
VRVWKRKGLHEKERGEKGEAAKGETRRDEERSGRF